MHMCDSHLTLSARVYVRPNCLLSWAVCPVDVLMAGDRDLPALYRAIRSFGDCN